jgi:PBSX family phage terminase large subunit
MLKSRLSTPNSKFDGTGNPASPSHWLKEFLETEGIDIFTQSYVIDDNPFNDPYFVASLKKEYAGTVYYDRFILGKWALAEGLVYPMFSKDKHTYNQAPWEDDSKQQEWYVSVDYGTINPMSMGLWHLHEGTAYRVREYYFDSREAKYQKTDEEYYEDLLNLVGEIKIDAVVVDPSAASFLATIRRHGMFKAREAKNAVLDGIRYTNTYLNAGRILIHESCKAIQKEFGLYSWDERSSEDKVVKEFDHAMDDLRYFVMTILQRRLR